MASSPILFRRSTRRGWSFVKMGLFMLAIGVAFTTWQFNSAALHKDRISPLVFLPLLIFGGVGLLFVGGGTFILLDRSVKLTLDEAGVTEHSNATSERRILWSEVQGIDVRIEARGQIGSAFVYRRHSDGTVTTEVFDLTGLEGGPVFVFTEFKRLWVQATNTNATPANN